MLREAMPRKTKHELDREINAALSAPSSPGEVADPNQPALAALEQIRQGCRASTGQGDLFLHRNRLYRWRQTTDGARGIGGVVEEQTGAGSPAGASASELKRRVEAGWQARDNFIFLRGGTLRGPSWMKRLAGQG